MLSLGVCSRRDAISKGIMLRAEVLRGELSQGRARSADQAAADALPSSVPVPAAATEPIYLRDVYDKWVDAKSRSADTLAACKRALTL